MGNSQISTRIVNSLNLPNMLGKDQRIVCLLECKKLKFPPPINRVVYCYHPTKN